jgi:hypothetical protein
LKGVIRAVMEPLMRSRILLIRLLVPGCGHICARPVSQYWPHYGRRQAAPSKLSRLFQQAMD